MKVLFASGGTGGHIYPGLAIAACLKRKNEEVKILFVGTKQGLEKNIIEQAGFPLVTLSIRPWLRKDFRELLVVSAQMIIGFFQSFFLLIKFHPTIVIATGAYISVPVVFASSLIGIPIFLHEQNLIPGKANRFLSHLKGIKKIGVTYEASKKYFPQGRVEITGNPVREELLQATRQEGRKKFGLGENKKVVLIFGGSRGARKINTSTANALKIWRDYAELQILHVTGKGLFKEVIQLLDTAHYQTANYLVYPYLYDMADALASADLVVSRAGATTLAEITARGVPSILIPYPYAANNHQEYNARYLEEKGAAKVILDQQLSGSILAQTVLDIINTPLRLRKMGEASKKLAQPAAGERISEIISNYVF